MPIASGGGVTPHDYYFSLECHKISSMANRNLQVIVLWVQAQTVCHLRNMQVGREVVYFADTSSGGTILIEGYLV